MGGLLATLRGALERFSRLERRVLLLGLDAAGKTTLLYRLQLGEIVSTIPTIGFNVETVSHRNMSLTVWDVGGQSKLRPLWRHYYHNTDALIFMVDSGDAERFPEAREALHQVLAAEELRDTIVLVMANKQDLPSAVDVEEVTHALAVRSLRQSWFVQPCVTLTMRGVPEGLDWIYDTLKKKMP